MIIRTRRCRMKRGGLEEGIDGEAELADIALVACFRITFTFWDWKSVARGGLQLVQGEHLPLARGRLRQAGLAEIGLVKCSCQISHRCLKNKSGNGPIDERAAIIVDQCLARSQKN